MAAIVINDFGGMAPIFRPRKLPDAMAVTARDTRFEGSGVGPRMQSRALDGSDGISVSDLSAQNWRTLFAHERSDGSVELLAWPDGHGLVHAVRSPVPGETANRVYWSRAGTFPRVASQPSAAIIAADSVGVVRRLGIPDVRNAANPGILSPVTATQSSDVETLAFGQVGSLSQTNPVTVSATVTPPFKAGQTVRVEHQGTTTTSGQPVNMSELNGRTFVVGTVTGNTFTLIGANGTTLSAAATPANIRLVRVYTEADKVTRSYLATLVSTDGEEGPPCVPSTPAEFNVGVPIGVSLQGVFPDLTWAQRTAINRIRIYRTSTGSETTDFFFLAEVAISTNSGSTAIPQTGAATFSDPNNDETQVLGEVLPSKDWQAPPTNLRGLTRMPNGYLVGYVGNTLYASEPYQPHAWPDRYRRTTNSEIRGLAVFGDTLVIATTGKPYIAQGADPSSLYLQELDEPAPCIFERTVVPVGIGVAWASREGVTLVNSGGPRNITASIFTRAQWEELLSSFTAQDWIFHNRRLIALSPEDSTPLRSWTIEFQPGGRFDFSQITTFGRAPVLNPATGRVVHLARTVVLSQAAYRTIDVLEGGALPATLVWRSKVFTMKQPMNFGAAQVFADAYPLTLRVRYGAPASPGAQPPAEPTTAFSVVLNGSDPVRLPAGFLSREWQVEIEGGVNVASVVLGETMEEIRQL
jgi:hypothetical protein